MSNVLGHTKQQQVLALGRLGWTLSRIEESTGVRRETISGYLKAAGIPVRGRGRPSEAKPKPAISPPAVSTDPPAKPAISGEVSTDSGPPTPATRAEVSTDSGATPRPGRAPSASACEPYRELIVEALGRGRNAMAIWQDLVDRHGFAARYASVRRFVRALRGATPAEARVVITTAPGEEAQVDDGDGPMVRHPKTGKYRRARLFVLTLGYSRKSVRLLALAKKHGPTVVEDAAKAAVDLGVPSYRFVRRYLERRPPMPLTLRQVDPLIRQLTLYRDLIDRTTGDAS